MASMVWHFMRMLRSQPPGLARTGRRADMFRAAMQQFEDLMSAAAASGPAGSPLPMYYALTQAGRAILAAREPDTSRADSEREHHGLSLRRSDVTDDDLLSVPVTVLKPDIGLFQRVAHATHSPELSGQAPLGALIASLPDAGDEGWTEPRWPRATPLYSLIAPVIDDPSSDPDVRVDTLSSFVAGRLRAALMTDAFSSPEELSAFAAQFPTLAGLTPSLPRMYSSGLPGRHEVVTPSGVAIEVELHVGPQSSDPLAAHRAALDAIAPLYRWKDRRWLRPSVEATSPPPSPLMTWWAVLFLLSSLARYHPIAWTRALQLDSSPIAAMLERTLALAQDALPHLVFEALGLSSGGPLLFPAGNDTPPVSQ